MNQPLKSKPRYRTIRTTLAPLGLALLTSNPLSAQEGTTEYLDPTLFDKTWALATLYKDDLNPWLEEFKLRGRYQGQYHDVDSHRDDSDGWEDRRSLFGFDAKLFEKKLEARLDFQSDDGFHNVYDGLVDAYLKWRPNEQFSLTVGKTKTLIAYGDWIPSVNDAPTFERSQIFNQLGINRATAITAEGENAGVLWQAGIYSNGTPSTTGGTGRWGDGEFGHLNGGISYGLGAGYNFNHELDLEKALLRLDWLHSHRKTSDKVLNRYDDILSLTFLAKTGYWNLTAESFAAFRGDGVNGDVFGFYLEPTYDLIPNKLQLVGRYSFATGDGPASLQAQSRYERETPIPAIKGVSGSKNRGQNYNAFYLGTQYFISGNKLKLLAGAEWARLGRVNRSSGYEGITTLLGVRFSF